MPKTNEAKRHLWNIRTVAVVLATILFSAAGLKVVLYGKVEADPQRVLNATNFEKPEQIGAVLFRRFWVDLQKQNLVVLASSPLLRDYDKIWQGFLAVAEKSGVHFQAVFAEPTLRPLRKANVWQNVGAINYVKIKEALDRGERVLVHTVATNGELKAFKESFANGFYVFEGLYPITEAQKSWNVCRPPEINAGPEKNPVESTPLECHTLKALKKYGKKRSVDWEKLTAIADQIDSRSFLLLVHEQQAQGFAK